MVTANLRFKYIHAGHQMATSELTGTHYVVRTRPKNDGWMAIDETEGLVIMTELTLFHAKQECERWDEIKHKEDQS